MNQKAFTLVEVMIVVAIIALLAAIAIPNLIRAKVQANETVAQTSLKSIATALENYASIYNIYPTSTSSLLGVTPPYLTTDYFTGLHFGYSYTANLASYTYLVTAIPSGSNQGTASFTITTGGLLTKN